MARLAPGDFAATMSGALDVAGNVALLGAALSLIVRAGRDDLGGIIDVTIIAWPWADSCGSAALPA